VGPRRVTVETIRYEAAGESFASELIYDERVAGKRPILLVAPNWFGVTPEWTERAGALAGDRYVAFLADVFGVGKRPQNRPEAAAMANERRADTPDWRRRLKAALDRATDEATRRGIGDPSKRAAIGFCFGGGGVFELARMGTDIQAAISVHGDLTGAMPAQPGAIKAALLAIHGSDDPIAPKARRDAFEAEMGAAGARWQMLVLGGLYHSFTDVGINLPPEARYDENAARQTYRLAHHFIADAFAGRL
jgi:dienelactone hydrolase